MSGPENDLELVRRGLLIESIFGWQDYADLATQTTPITLTNANQYYPLTNDGAGPYTDLKYKVYDHTDTWDVTNNQFDFSSLNIGDTVDIRVDVIIDPPVGNTDVDVKMTYALGSPTQYDLLIEHVYIKGQTTKNIVFNHTMYIGSDDVKNYPAKIYMKSDAAGTTVKVNGWFVRTICRG